MFGMSAAASSSTESRPGWRSLLRKGSKDEKARRTQSVSSDELLSEETFPLSNIHRQGLHQKYGKMGKVVGEGAGGSVKLLTRESDGVTFAVKRFRPKFTFEDQGGYVRKIVAEFWVGSLHRHGNIIETLDLFEEHQQWYQVMEYAPYDLFECVSSRQMSQEETDCSFMQILTGVNYIHSLGFAHRDLKLENVVVTENGIMKIIDFGSAVLCKQALEKGNTFASGVVGCSAYMAPEVLQYKTYDPQCADLWSLAIMYCCMCLGRFPWKVASLDVRDFRLFASSPIQRTNTELETLGTTTRSEFEVGPFRLLKKLPCESRVFIGGMLQLKPQKRLTIQQVCNGSWATSTDTCSQDEHRTVHRAHGHEHILQPR